MLRVFFINLNLQENNDPFLADLYTHKAKTKDRQVYLDPIISHKIDV